jgi:hypothetical protein
VTEKSKSEKPSMQWVPSPSGVIEIYANLATLQWSLDDVRVRVAQMINSPETPNPGDDLVAIAQERVAVTMSWRNAKRMRDSLIEAIDAYERKNGEIVIDLKLPYSKQELES